MPASQTSEPAAFTIVTLRRPEGMHDSEYDRAAGRWIWHTPATTFIAVEGQDLVWLLTAGTCNEWRTLSRADARAEWKRLASLNYTRSDKHTVDVVALATLSEDQDHVINDDWNCYSAGVARAAVAPVLRWRGRYERRFSSSWSICFAVECTTAGKHSGRKVGTHSVETASVYDYQIATAIRADSKVWGCTFEGISEDVLVKPPHANGVSYIAA